MSTAPLLILSARLRGLAHAGGTRDPASSIALNGRGRVTRGVAASTSPIRRSNGGIGPFLTLPAGRPILPLACAGALLPPLRRARVLLLAALFLALGSQPVRAQSVQEPAAPLVIELDRAEVTAERPRVETRIGGEARQGPCVIVDIAGDRAGHLDCATRRLTDAARIAQSEARAGIDAPVVGAGSADIHTGVANQSATRLRMGSALGTSVHPERPASRPPRVPRP